MAQTLLDDFFRSGRNRQRQPVARHRKLRFSHAKSMIPMAAILGLPGMSEPLPRAATCNYDNSNWRGEAVAPVAAPASVGCLTTRGRAGPHAVQQRRKRTSSATRPS
ncbi:hypothetical protein [Duganella sp. BJB1802]|uniref:hypothetical protein n=1 Tax=Duganella sp. BJB1802 TaxID=2744575 RepID=UPI001C3C7D27|nr:hypothetical protein [Duganella sp. BJB1802]